MSIGSRQKTKHGINITRIVRTDRSLEFAIDSTVDEISWLTKRLAARIRSDEYLSTFDQATDNQDSRIKHDDDRFVRKFDSHIICSTSKS